MTDLTEAIIVTEMTRAEKADGAAEVGETSDVSEAAASKPEQPSGGKKLPYAAAFALRIGAAAVAVWLLLTLVVGVYVCHDNASFPMVKDGDFCLTFRPAVLMAGDAVVYRSGGETRFGRVVALAGDRVEMTGDVLLVNGENVVIPTVYPTTAEGSSITYPYTVPEGCVFILHDYRSDMTDSRTAGAVPLRDCQGSIFFLMRRRGI